MADPTAIDDLRASAAMAVLRGEATQDVAARLGVETAVVARWTQQFVEAGAAAQRGEAPADPAARDRFLALVSHELRTPLSVMRGWIEMLRVMPADERPGHLVDTGLAAMAAHAVRLERLADDLLDSAAVSMGRLALQVEEVDVGGLIGEVVSSFAGDRVAVVGSAPVLLRADPGRLGQMLTNLVDEGLGRCDARLTLSARTDERWVTLRLHVPGEPPPFEEMHALFEPFDRGTADARTGLALYVTRALAVAHGGQCGVDADDSGLYFWLRLPTAGPPSPGTE